MIAGTADGVLRDLPQYEKLGVSRLILDFPAFVSNPHEMASILDRIAAGANMDEENY